MPGPNGAGFVPYSPDIAYEPGSTGDAVKKTGQSAGIVGLGGNDYFKVNSYGDEVAALAAAQDGHKIVYGKRAYDRTASLVVPPKKLILGLEQSSFIMRANVTALTARSGITGLFALAMDYVPGSREVVITLPPGAKVSDYFKRNRRCKFLSNALDLCNRNEGVNAAQYRQGEWSIIWDIDDVNNKIILGSALRYIKGLDGQLTPPDPANRAEVYTYTVANNVRVFMPVDLTLNINGGSIEYEDEHEGAWSASCVDIMGWQGVRVDGLEIAGGYGQGISSACYGAVYENVTVRHLSDFARLGSGSALGYVFNENGWASSVTGLRGFDARHITTTGGSAVVADATTVGLLFGWGRQAGSVFTNCAGGGMTSAVFDTHLGADDFSFVDCAALSGQGYGFTARGRNIHIVRPRVQTARGIFAFSEYQDRGLPDLPGHSGKGRQNLTSCAITSPMIRCEREALSATAAYMAVEGRSDIEVGAYDAFHALSGGLMDFIGGRHDVRVTGAALSAGPLAQQGIFSAQLASAVYGITGLQGFRVGRAAAINIDAALANDALAMRLFAGPAGTDMEVKGGINAVLNNGFDALISGIAGQAGVGTLTVDQLADWSITGTAATREASMYPRKLPDGSWTASGRVVALADDGVTSIVLPVDSGIFELGCYDNVVLAGSASSLGVTIAFAAPLLSTSERTSLMAASNAAYVEVLEDSDFTVPGTDGKLCIASSDSGNTAGFTRIYINNRLGAAISFHWQLRAGNVQGS